MSDTAKKQVRKLKIIEDDPNLSAFEGDLNERVRHFKQRKKELLAPGQTLTEFASGHLYYGFHKVKGGWVYREWAPGATAMHLIGEFNNWDRTSHPMKAVGDGNWEIMIPGVRTLRHRSKVKVAVTSARGTEDRIPLYATYVVQDEKTHNFSAAIWNPRKEFEWTDGKFRPKKNVPPLIYEARTVNDGKPAWVAERIGRDVKPGAKVAVLGMSFKANIDDTRESPSVLFANILKEKGYEVIACEPFIRGDVAGYKNHTLEEAIAACDYAVITLMHTPFVENKALIATKPYYDCVGLMRK